MNMARMGHYRSSRAKVTNDLAANLIVFRTLQGLVWICEKTDTSSPPAAAWDMLDKIVQIDDFGAKMRTIARNSNG